MEELALLDTRINKCQQLISHQRMRLRKAHRPQDLIEESERLLSNLNESLVAMQALRRIVDKEVKSGPSRSAVQTQEVDPLSADTR